MSETLDATPTTYREAQPCDAPLLATLGRQFYAESGYADLVLYDEASAQAQIEAMIQGGVVFLAQRGLDVVGFIGGQLTAPWFNQHARMATEYAWWVHPQVRGSSIALRLLGMFESWAEAHAVAGICLTDLAGIESPAMSILARKGYTVAERAHVKGFQ